MKARWILFGLALGCAEAPGPDVGSAVPVVDGASLELMYFVLGPDGVARFGGLNGAIADPTSAWRLRTETGEEADLIPDAMGTFEVALRDPSALTATLHRGEESVAVFQQKDATAARLSAVWPPIGGAGSVPNDLVFVGSAPSAELVLVRSGDHAVSVLDLELGLESDRGLRLPERDSSEGTLGAQPWFAAPTEDGERIVVTAFLHHASYLVHLPSLRVEATFRTESQLPVEPAQVLPYPVDLEGDGSSRLEISRFVPRSPQGVTVIGSQLFVAYSGFVAPRLAASMPPIYLPGVLARFSIERPELAPALLSLPLRNPQAISWDAARQRLLVVASGILDADPTVRAVSEGGVMEIDPSTMSIIDVHPLDDFAPGSVLPREGELWVSSLVRPEVACVPLEGGSRATLRLNDEEVDSVFRLVELPGGWIGAPSFNTDRLHFIDPQAKALDPSPFFGPLQLGPGRPIFDGLQIVARRPGRAGVDFVGPDLFALAGVASRVVPVELRKVLGP